MVLIVTVDLAALVGPMAGLGRTGAKALDLICSSHVHEATCNPAPSSVIGEVLCYAFAILAAGAWLEKGQAGHMVDGPARDGEVSMEV